MLSDLSHNIGPTALLPVFISNKLEQDHEPKEAQPSILSINNALFIVLHAICAMQVMSGIEPPHLFQRVGLLCTKIWQSANIFMMRMVGATFG